MHDLTLTEIITILRRRRPWFVAIALLCFLGSFAFALRWSHYAAQVTVRIAAPQVASSVASVGSVEPAEVSFGLADRRISQIYQQITASEPLGALIAKEKLYPPAETPAEAQQQARAMRKNLKLSFENSLAIQPAAAQKESVEQLSSTAFTLRFTHRDPELSKRGVDALVAALIEADAKDRAARHQQTLTLLDGEIAAIATTIAAQEKQIAEFRAVQGESGPAAQSFQQQASLSSGMNLQAIETQLATAQATLASANAQLATTDPHLSMVEDGKLVPSSMSQRKQLESQLAALSGRYGANHPEILAIQAQLKALKSPRGKAASAAADNPVYLQLSAQRSASLAQIKSLEEQRTRLMSQKQEFDSQLKKQPELEAKMAALTLDLDHAKERHRMLMDKHLAAEMRAKLDASDASMRLQVIEPSLVPTTTTPPRTLLMLVGLILSILISLIAVVVLELMRQEVRSGHHLLSLTGAPPLVTIPVIASPAGGTR